MPHEVHEYAAGPQSAVTDRETPWHRSRHAWRFLFARFAPLLPGMIAGILPVNARAWKCAVAALLVAAAGLPSYSGAQQPDLLEPEKAFRISTQMLDERNLEVRFEIADGYYLYRDRFKFETAAGKLLADVGLPKGKVKEDPFFGKTETYRREVRIRVPVTAGDLARGIVKLKVTSQGCADIGVCYVPLEQFVEVRLPGRSSNAPAMQIPPPPAWTDIPPKAPRKGTAAVPQGGSR